MALCRFAALPLCHQSCAVLAGRSLTRPPARLRSQRTPPMGWSSWNCFGGAQSQEKMVTVAEAIISLGLRDLVRFFPAILDEFRRVFNQAPVLC